MTMTVTLTVMLMIITITALFNHFLLTDLNIETKTNVVSLAANNNPSTGLTIHKMSNSSFYEVRVTTMDELEWLLTINGSGASHGWEHMTVTWHEMWVLKVYINGENASVNNTPEFTSFNG